MLALSSKVIDWSWAFKIKRAVVVVYMLYYDCFTKSTRSMWTGAVRCIRKGKILMLSCRVSAKESPLYRKSLILLGWVSLAPQSFIPKAWVSHSSRFEWHSPQLLGVCEKKELLRGEWNGRCRGLPGVCAVEWIVKALQGTKWMWDEVPEKFYETGHNISLDESVQCCAVYGETLPRTRPYNG